MRFLPNQILCGALALSAASSAVAADGAARNATLLGTYQSIADGRVLPGGLKNQGSPAQIQPLTSAARPRPGEPGQQDPYALCQAVGPFRMMAQPATKIELVPAPGRVVMLFEDVSHGYLRSLYLDRPHLQNYQPKYAFQGDSIAHWEGDALVIDTIGFNERTWLNEQILASDALHLVERIRPIDKGRYLEYRMTATDPKSLRTAYSYTRYFEKTDAQIEEDTCVINNAWNPAL
ncbi:MAG: hypothetical protein QM718_11380 [Steroidobacteraceae bacterium]